MFSDESVKFWWLWDKITELAGDEFKLIEKFVGIYTIMYVREPYNIQLNQFALRFIN